jgi:hypothetical protein
LAVFPFETITIWGILQSSIHYCWAWEYSSTNLSLLNYSPTDCFETFPFPEHAFERCSGNERLDATGNEYYLARKDVMCARNEGLTKTYNRVHDPDESAADVQKLRDLHVKMDQVVAAAYGWTDLSLSHGFHEAKQGVRFTICESARREVLQRLLKLNHERFAEEERQGLHGKKGAGKKVAPKKNATNKSAKQEAGLFDGEGDE